MVALRKESVDRNDRNGNGVKNLSRSLSARRAWIEIIGTATALKTSLGSLSARRAWIEIFQQLSLSQLYQSLSARRAWIEILLLSDM